MVAKRKEVKSVIKTQENGDMTQQQKRVAVYVRVSARDPSLEYKSMDEQMQDINNSVQAMG